MKNKLPFIVVWWLVGLAAASAQTSSFTYQGRLTDGAGPANGNYDLQVALWDSLSGGGQVGSTQTLNTVAVSNGVFTVSLDFGANAFNGASRFLEISARPSTGGSFTLLSPRQQITSTPYAVRSLNATTADNVPANGVSPGSGNYIQNTSSPQSSSNFNISGNGTAGGTLSGNVINATTQFNLNGSRILSNPGMDNLYVGLNAGKATTTGVGNTLVGAQAGAAIMTGSNNSVFGISAGQAISRGNGNAIFGHFAGSSNTDGTFNAFFGGLAGLSNTLGESNSYFGQQAGQNATGSFNTFVGASADFALIPDFSPSGNRNTLLGAFAALGSGGQFSPNNATAIGANARVDQSNSLVLGSINGVNGGTDTNVGIGTTTPSVRLHVIGTTGLMGNVGIGTTTPSAKLSVVATGDGATVLHLGIERAWVFKQFGTGSATALELAGGDPNNNNKNFLINTTGFVGIGTTSPTATLSVNGSANKPGGGSWTVFSDERLKNIRGRFTPGLNAVMQLQPLRYEYKRDNVLHLKAEGEQIGFSAQAVQKIVPEAVTKDASGYLLVNNDPILWTMLNAIKEQQAQIATLQQVNSALNARLQKLERERRKKSSASRRQ